MDSNHSEDSNTLTFDLSIHRQGEGYLARCRDASGLEGQGPFHNPFQSLEIKYLWLRLGRSRPSRRLGDNSAELTREFGDRLFRTVFRDLLLRRLEASRQKAQQEERTLLIRLKLQEVPELADLPWEFLHDEQAADPFLALAPRSSIVRTLETPSKRRPTNLPDRLRILVVTSEPEGYGAIDTDLEYETIITALQPLREANRVDIERLDHPDPLLLQEKLDQAEFHILHFAGHGGFSEQRQTGALVFAPEDAPPRTVPGGNLGTLLSGHDSLHLVVLNACEGARAGNANTFSGTAQTLVHRGVPAVLAMQSEVTDEIALELARQFYGHLGRGRTLDESLTRARITIQTHHESEEWGIPVLFLRSRDFRLLPPGPLEAPSRAPRDPETLLWEKLGRNRLAMRLHKNFQPLANTRAQIDSDLVTCAEYQLFLGADPLHRQYRPDHWPEDGLPVDSEGDPITGLRSEDVEAFLRWLDTWPDAKGWRHRAPTVEEHRELPCGVGPSPPTSPDASSPTSVRVWCRNGEAMMLDETRDPIGSRCQEHLGVLASGYLRRCLVLAIRQYPRLCNALSFSRNPSRDGVLEKAAVRAIEEVSALQTISLSLDPEGHLQKRLTIPLEDSKTLVKELGRTRSLARDLSRLCEHPRCSDLERISDQDLDRWQEFVTERLEGVQPTTLATALDRCLGLVRDPAQDLARIRELGGFTKALRGRTLAQSPTLRDGARLALLFVAHQRSAEVSLKISTLETLPSQGRSKHQPEVDRLLRAFWALALFDERLRGTHPPYEGLRLVRERAP